MPSCGRSEVVWTMVFGVMLAGCGGKAPAVERRISSAQLDSLPIVSVSDGRRVCEATGRDPCPLHRAVANWIGAGRFALWEPGNLVRIYDA